MGQNSSLSLTVLRGANWLVPTSSAAHPTATHGVIAIGNEPTACDWEPLRSVVNTPSIFLGRGVYQRTVVEGWDYRNGQLTQRFHFDTSDTQNNNNKDGKPNSAYAGQGNHSFSVADLDGDGKDEVMYGSMAIDDAGNGLWTTGLGHGDAQHVGKFLPDREGLQVYHCLEGGKTMVALHDAKTSVMQHGHLV